MSESESGNGVEPGRKAGAELIVTWSVGEEVSAGGQGRSLTACV